MAEKGSTRRQSFRRNRDDACLPDEYLELLEQKRKQLDESIHKYIASKERDYKAYEKDVLQQYKQEQGQDGGRAARASLDSTRSGGGSPRMRAQQQQPQSVVDALLAAGIQQEHIGQPLSVAVIDNDGSPRLEAKSAAGLLDRRASIERDKEFVGVFTPAFLPALENKTSSKTMTPPQRAESAPAGRSADAELPTIIRASSDHGAQAKARRPVELQLAQRTSSSGSSADGKLHSALKSPTQGTKPKRKRVSLAVGDTIVKPSDNVPATLLNNNRTPSHSRTRSQLSDPEREQSMDSKVANGNETKEADVQMTTPPLLADMPADASETPEFMYEQRQSAATAGPASVATPPSSPPERPDALNADGDLFGLEDEMMPNSNADVDHLSESDDDNVAGRINIAGRVGRRVSPNETFDSSFDFSSEAEPGDDDPGEQFILGSAVASQQPTLPGFRRPSATLDPIYAGPNYERAEHSAVVNEIYGSSYNRPASKGSFTPGSLGESYMARNAQHLREHMKDRERSGGKS